MRGALGLIFLFSIVAGPAAADVTAPGPSTQDIWQAAAKRGVPPATFARLSYPDQQNGQTPKVISKTIPSKGTPVGETIQCVVPPTATFHLFDWALQLERVFIKIRNKSQANLSMRWGVREVRNKPGGGREAYWKWGQWSTLERGSESSLGATNKFLGGALGPGTGPQRIDVRYEIKDAGDGSWIWGAAPYEITCVLHYNLRQGGPHR